jgi:hypothetical protein
MISVETLATSVDWGSGTPNVRLDDDDIFIGVVKAV